MGIERLLDPIRTRIRLIVGRGLLEFCRKGENGLVVDVSLLAGERRLDIDHIQQFGFTSFPKGETQVVSLFIAGSRDNGVVVATRGEASEMNIALESGEVAMHAPFGQSIIMRKDGNIEISAAAGKKIVCDAEKFEISGDLEVQGEITTMKTGMVTLSGHIHPTGTGPSGKPTPGQ